jgi:hypothetical protein
LLFEPATDASGQYILCFANTTNGFLAFTPTLNDVKPNLLIEVGNE